MKPAAVRTLALDLSEIGPVVVDSDGGLLLPSNKTPVRSWASHYRAAWEAFPPLSRYVPIIDAAFAELGVNPDATDAA